MTDRPEHVYLTKQGERRVLDGKAGMLFKVDHWGGIDDRGAQVEDRRYPNEHRPYQIWTLGPGDFEPA